MSYSRTIVVGNLGKEPESRLMPNGDMVCNFNVAASEEYTYEGEKREKTLWYRVSVFGRLAEVCKKRLRKGSTVLVGGRLLGDSSGNPRTYTKRDGTTGTSFELEAKTVKFLSSSQSEEQQQTTPEDEVEIPF